MTLKTWLFVLTGWFLGAYFLGGYAGDGRGENGLSKAVLSTTKSWAVGIPVSSNSELLVNSYFPLIFITISIALHMEMISLPLMLSFMIFVIMVNLWSLISASIRNNFLFHPLYHLITRSIKVCSAQKLLKWYMPVIEMWGDIISVQI